MPALIPYGPDEERAMEFMRRFTTLILKAADGELTVDDDGLEDIEADMGMTKAEAVAILEVRLRPN